jgi:hypothetical protein
MQQCRNCYYRSIIGFESWCCHPAIGKRIKDTGRNCADHIYYDYKGGIGLKKMGYGEMIEKATKPKEKTYRLIHAGTAIECKVCGLTSFNINDIKLKFCCNCKLYHDDEEKCNDT